MTRKSPTSAVAVRSKSSLCCPPPQSYLGRTVKNQLMVVVFHHNAGRRPISRQIYLILQLAMDGRTNDCLWYTNVYTEQFNAFT